MLAGQTIQETGGRPGTIPVKNERTCSQCRHWDLEHVQRGEFDDEAILIEEYFARCMNLKSPCASQFMEADDGCEAFEHR